MKLVFVVTLAMACTPAPVERPATTTTWPVPAGWRGEIIPFPLDFAPAVVHRGVEELRFSPDFFHPGTPGYWTYAFAWRLDDDATLDGPALAAELTAYFRGLVAAVDDKHRIASLDPIAVRAVPDHDGFALSIHSFDAFGTAAPIDLVGRAARTVCGAGALWVFSMAPAGAAVPTELAAQARCGQHATK